MMCDDAFSVVALKSINELHKYMPLNKSQSLTAQLSCAAHVIIKSDFKLEKLDG